MVGQLEDVLLQSQKISTTFHILTMVSVLNRGKHINQDL